MGAIASITLNDGKTTPVAHVFTPRGILNPVNGKSSPQIGKWQDSSGGIAVGYPTLTLSVREPLGARRGNYGDTGRNFRVTLRVVLPVLEVVSNNTIAGIAPAPTKAYDVICTLEMVAPERSDLPTRKDIFAFVKNALSNSQVVAAFQDLESPY